MTTFEQWFMQRRHAVAKVFVPATFIVKVEWWDGKEYVSPTVFNSVGKALYMASYISRDFIESKQIISMHIICVEDGKHMECFHDGEWVAK